MSITPNSIVTPQTVNAGTPQTWANSDGTTAKTVYTAGSNGSVVRGINATTTDTSANIVNLTRQVAGSGSFFQIGAPTVPASSGTNGTAASKDLNNISDIPSSYVDAAGNRVIVLGPNDVLQCAPQSAVTSGKLLTIQAFGQDF